MKKRLKTYFRKISPILFYLLQYRRASGKLNSNHLIRYKIFNEFINSCNRGKCLQIGVKDEIGKKFGDNWVSIDLYDKRDFIDFNQDIQKLDFKDKTFEAIVCWSILEHVPQPHTAINEMYRVLAPGGKIWVQLPFLYPYHGTNDYWRVSPDGLRLWMSAFEEISCGIDLWAGTSIIVASFFYGRKSDVN